MQNIPKSLFGRIRESNNDAAQGQTEAMRKEMADDKRRLEERLNSESNRDERYRKYRDLGIAESNFATVYAKEREELFEQKAVFERVFKKFKLEETKGHDEEMTEPVNSKGFTAAQNLLLRLNSIQDVKTKSKDGPKPKPKPENHDGEPLSDDLLEATKTFDYLEGVIKEESVHMTQMNDPVFSEIQKILAKKGRLPKTDRSFLTSEPLKGLFHKFEDYGLTLAGLEQKIHLLPSKLKSDYVSKRIRVKQTLDKIISRLSQYAGQIADRVDKSDSEFTAIEKFEEYGLPAAIGQKCMIDAGVTNSKKTSRILLNLGDGKIKILLDAYVSSYLKYEEVEDTPTCTTCIYKREDVIQAFPDNYRSAIADILPKDELYGIVFKERRLQLETNYTSLDGVSEGTVSDSIRKPFQIRSASLTNVKSILGRALNNAVLDCRKTLANFMAVMLAPPGFEEIGLAKHFDEADPDQLFKILGNPYVIILWGLIPVMDTGFAIALKELISKDAFQRHAISSLVLETMFCGGVSYILEYNKFRDNYLLATYHMGASTTSEFLQRSVDNMKKLILEDNTTGRDVNLFKKAAV